MSKKKLGLTVVTLLSSLTVCPTPIAYADPSASEEIQTDEVGAGCMGTSGNDGSDGERSTGLSDPQCVGSGCMGYDIP